VSCQVKNKAELYTSAVRMLISRLPSLVKIPRGKQCCSPFRPGCCAKHGLAEAYKTSIDFPDETLSFIKSHPLMDSAVPSVVEEPWFTKTRVRYDTVEKSCM